MGWFQAGSSSYLGRSSPVGAAAANKTSHRSPGQWKLIIFSPCKPIISISSCSTGPTHYPSSSPPLTSSYSRRWHNPLRQRRPSAQDSPEIFRHWIHADPHPNASEERFTIVSYNILADRNAFKHKDLYPNVPLDYLKWNHRKSLICKELTAMNPDIICMQEVDKYFDLFSIMEKAGYVGSYKRRTGDYVDGCAMFWKTDKFQLLEETGIRYRDFGLRDNVAQLCAFEIRGVRSRRLVVGNIHVLYNPSRGEVKLGQIGFLSSKAKMLSERWGNVPVVLAGDFNTTPQSAIYKFLSSSELNVKLYDKRNLSGQRSCHPTEVFRVKEEMSNPFAFMDSFLPNRWTDEDVKVTTCKAECDLAAHPLKLSSSYASVKGFSRTRDSSGEPLATSYHHKFFGTVDYLWYSNGLIPTRVLDMLPADTLRRTHGLPCEKLGSDHLALVSEFAFAEGIDERQSHQGEDGGSR